MNKCRKEKVSLFLLLIMLLATSHIAAEEPTSTSGGPVAQTASSVTVPDLSEIIPLAAELSGRLAALETKVQSPQDLASMQKKYTDIEATLDRYVDRFTQLKQSQDYRASKLRVLMEEIQDEKERLDDVSKSIKKEVSKREIRRKEWLAEKKRWGQWQASWGEDLPDRLEPIFVKVNEKIEKGLSLTGPHLEIMLDEQENVGAVQEKLYALTAEVNRLIEEKRLDAFLTTSPPMFSVRYVSQFRSDLWGASLEGVEEMVWSSLQYSSQWGKVLLVQGLVFAVLVVSVFRKRKVLSESVRWAFLAARPFSASVFFIGAVTVVIHEYEGAPPVIKLINEMIGGIALARVFGGMTQINWKRQFVYGLMGLLIVIRLIQEVSFPLPLSRLYVVLAGAVSLVFCWRWARQIDSSKQDPLYAALLRLVCVFLAVIIIAQIWGAEALSFYLFMSATRSIAAVLAFVLLNHMIAGGLQWLFGSSPLRRVVGFYGDDINAVISRVARFIGIAFAGLILLPGILMTWGVYQNLNEAMKGFWTFGFKLGALELTLRQVIIAVGVFYGSFVISRILQKLSLGVVLRKGEIEKGVQLSIQRLIHYAVLFIGFMLAISMLGFELTKFTIMLSALGVGIGFGLQSVVNNFVSGLILLFERPIRVGDTVEIGGHWAEVKKIGLRATTVQTYDQSDLIVPNADLTTQQVTNWTLSSRQVRLIIPVGVAYGSDVQLVHETLIASAKANSMVSESPESQVLFLKFGESSLDFELRVWVNDASYRLIVMSELHYEIDRRFREANIVIAFPQRDLHLRSVNESINVNPK